MNVDELFESVVDLFASAQGITQAKMFGAPGLRIDGKVFACLFKGKLVVKLPKQRVDALVASGEAERFDPGMGRLMKEWVALEPSAEAEWHSIAQESCQFVSGARV